MVAGSVNEIQDVPVAPPCAGVVPLNIKFKSIIENVLMGLRNEKLKLKDKHISEAGGMSNGVVDEG